MAAGTWQERALLLRLRELGESDLVIDALGWSSGRLSAVAKGARRSFRRFVGVLLTGQVVELLLARPKRGLPRVEEARVVEDFRGIREQWRRWVFASGVVELLLRVVGEGQGRGLGELGAGALGAIEQAGDVQRMGSALAVFMSRLAVELGYGLNLEECIDCGRPGAVVGRAAAVSVAGGLVCATHKRGAGVHMLPVGAVRAMKAAQEMEVGAVWRLGLERGWVGPVLRFWQEFWERLAPGELVALGEAAALGQGRGLVL